LARARFCGAFGERAPSRRARARWRWLDVRENIRDHVRWWDLAVTLGVGLERGNLFAELRYARGLVTIHSDEPGLFIVNEELGLWVGVVQ
jgi:hypothetical protein